MSSEDSWEEELTDSSTAARFNDVRQPDVVLTYRDTDYLVRGRLEVNGEMATEREDILNLDPNSEEIDLVYEVVGEIVEGPYEDDSLEPRAEIQEAAPQIEEEIQSAIEQYDQTLDFGNHAAMEARH